MKGFFKVDNELHTRACVRAAKRDPMTRQIASLWVGILSLAKECQNGGRLEHDGGPLTIDELGDHTGIVVPGECVTRDVTLVTRDVTLACVTRLLEWGWLEQDGDVFVVVSWGEWNEKDEARLERNRAQSRERSQRYRDRKAEEKRHAIVTRDVTRDLRDVTHPETDPDPETKSPPPGVPPRGGGSAPPGSGPSVPSDPDPDNGRRPRRRWRGQPTYSSPDLMRQAIEEDIAAGRCNPDGTPFAESEPAPPDEEALDPEEVDP